MFRGTADVVHLKNPHLHNYFNCANKSRGGNSLPPLPLDLILINKGQLE